MCALRDDSKRSSQALDNDSFVDQFQMYKHLGYGYDGTNAVPVKTDDIGNTLTVGALQDSTADLTWVGGNLITIVKVVNGQTKTTTFGYNGSEITDIDTVIS
jgi:hypothetical protein